MAHCLKVAFTRPLTAPKKQPLPPNFKEILAESDLPGRFARKFPWLGAGSECLARLYVALLLLRLRNEFDVIVTGRYGEFFALLQSLVPFGRKPHILLDIEWLARPAKRSLRAGVSRWLHRRIVSATTRIQVFCEVEAESYAKYYKVDRRKFVWIPYLTDFTPPTECAVTRHFIFSSGSKERDYATLFTAIEQVPAVLRVAAPGASIRGLRVPSNVEIAQTTSPENYWRMLGESRFVVLSLQSHLLRHPGVMTYLAAMRMGKCVVVNDPEGASSYIEHGRTGFLVNPADPAALRFQISALLDDPDTLETIGAQAQQAILERFSPERYYSTIERVIQETF